MDTNKLLEYEDYRELIRKVASEEIDSRILKSWKFWVVVIAAPIVIGVALKIFDNF